jgi:hypothetical protein
LLKPGEEKRWHAQGPDEKCPLCQHPEREAAEAAYARWTVMCADIAKMLSVPRAVVEAHMKTLGLTESRSFNIDPIISHIIEKKMEDISPADISVKDVVALTRLRAKLDGKIVDKVEAQRPTVIILNAPPTRGMLMGPAASEDNVIPATFSETLVLREREPVDE